MWFTVNRSLRTFINSNTFITEKETELLVDVGLRLDIADEATKEAVDDEVTKEVISMDE